MKDNKDIDIEVLETDLNKSLVNNNTFDFATYNKSAEQSISSTLSSKDKLESVSDGTSTGTDIPSENEELKSDGDELSSDDSSKSLDDSESSEQVPSNGDSSEESPSTNDADASNNGRLPSNNSNEQKKDDKNNVSGDGENKEQDSGDKNHNKKNNNPDDNNNPDQKKTDGNNPNNKNNTKEPDSQFKKNSASKKGNNGYNPNKYNNKKPNIKKPYQKHNKPLKKPSNFLNNINPFGNNKNSKKSSIVNELMKNPFFKKFALYIAGGTAAVAVVVAASYAYVSFVSYVAGGTAATIISIVGTGSDEYWWPIGSLDPDAEGRHSGEPFTTRVTSEFGWRCLTGYPCSTHRGIDVSDSGINGVPIIACKDGTVVAAGWSSGGYGNYVKIIHDDGNHTLYAHMLEINVQVGTEVGQGQKIGAVGSTGFSTGPHLHFEVWENGVRVDPLTDENNPNGYVSAENPRPETPIKHNTRPR